MLRVLPRAAARAEIPKACRPSCRAWSSWCRAGRPRALGFPPWSLRLGRGRDGLPRRAHPRVEGDRVTPVPAGQPCGTDPVHGGRRLTVTSENTASGDASPIKSYLPLSQIRCQGRGGKGRNPKRMNHGCNGATPRRHVTPDVNPWNEKTLRDILGSPTGRSGVRRKREKEPGVARWFCYGPRACYLFLTSAKWV